MLRPRPRQLLDPRPEDSAPMNRRGVRRLLTLALLAATAAVTTVSAQELVLDGAVDPARGHARIDHTVDDAPALFDEKSVAPIAELAQELSARHDWLTPDALDVLARGALRLDEAFPAAPAFMTVDGTTYKIRIEPVGADARDLDPEFDSWYVFLSPEVYDGLGENRFLAFRDGVQTVLTGRDLERLPTAGLTLAGLSSEAPQPGDLIAGTTSRIELGDFSPAALNSPRLLAAAGRAPHKNSCDGVAPSSCSQGQPICSDPNREPYFILDAINIKTKHERRGSSPEIELFPLLPEVVAVNGTNLETEAIFDGRIARDMAGRYRFLPDINTTHTFHTINNGYALFPTDMGTEWAALLVEDDKNTGKLDVNSTAETTMKVFTTAVNFQQAVKKMDDFKLLKSIKDLFDLLFNNNGDDCFEHSIAIDRALFCNDALGQPFPHVFTLDSAEWTLQGHFACIEENCAPPPPLDASVSGPSALDPWEVGTYTCTASHGAPPYTYTWHKGYGTTGPVVGGTTTSNTSHSIGLADTVDFQVTCDVTDSAGDSDSAVKGVVVEQNSTGCDPVQCNATCGGLGQCLGNDQCLCI
ncbi:MAG: hypothetical protein AAGM22_09560 [Acidobacteriota bacterium]